MMGNVVEDKFEFSKKRDVFDPYFQKSMSKAEKEHRKSQDFVDVEVRITDEGSKGITFKILRQNGTVIMNLEKKNTSEFRKSGEILIGGSGDEIYLEKLKLTKFEKPLIQGEELGRHGGDCCQIF